MVEADLLLHVVDLSHSQATERILAVNSVLGEIGAVNKCVLMVFNKTDCPGTAELLGPYVERFPNSVGVSAKTGEGVPALLAKLGSLMSPDRELVRLAIPQGAPQTLATSHKPRQISRQEKG